MLFPVIGLVQFGARPRPIGSPTCRKSGSRLRWSGPWADGNRRANDRDKQTGRGTHRAAGSETPAQFSAGPRPPWPLRGAAGRPAWRQTHLWRDSETLWTHTVACSPANTLAIEQPGLPSGRAGKVDEAIAQYQRALEIRPDFAKAHNNLGNALAGRGRTDEAIRHYQQALEIKPDFAEAHNNLGIALARRGQTHEAIAHFERAVRPSPISPMPTMTWASPWRSAEKSTRRSVTSEGAGNPARLRRGPRQPRRRPGHARATRQGDRPVPKGPGNQARVGRGPRQPSHRPDPGADGPARRLPTSAGPWRSSPIWPRPAATSASFMNRGRASAADGKGPAAAPTAANLGW